MTTPTGTREPTGDIPELPPYGSLSGDERRRAGDLLRARYEAGQSIRTLVAATGYSFGRIYRLLNEAGATLRPLGRPKDQPAPDPADHQPRPPRPAHRQRDNPALARLRLRRLLRQAREAAGLTQAEAADKVGVSTTKVVRIENSGSRCAYAGSSCSTTRQPCGSSSRRRRCCAARTCR